MKQRSNAQKIGDLIYKAREAKGLSTGETARRIGVHPSSLRTIQLGEVAQPKPAILTALAEELDLNVGELFALAGYRSHDDLPDLKGWLNIKHRALPDEDVDSLQNYLDYLVDRQTGKRSDTKKIDRRKA